MLETYSELVLVKFCSARVRNPGSIGIVVKLVLTRNLTLAGVAKKGIPEGAALRAKLQIWRSRALLAFGLRGVSSCLAGQHELFFIQVGLDDVSQRTKERERERGVAAVFFRRGILEDKPSIL